MPIWTYECVNDNCKETLEVLILTAQERKDCEEYLHNGEEYCLCPKCNSHTMKRVIGLTAKGIVK